MRCIKVAGVALAPPSPGVEGLGRPPFRPYFFLCGARRVLLHGRPITALISGTDATHGAGGTPRHLALTTSGRRIAVTLAKRPDIRPAAAWVSREKR